MEKITYESFIFMPGMTIEAAIRLKNNYVHGEELSRLMTLFNYKNGMKIPKPGENFFIPVRINENI